MPESPIVTPDEARDEVEPTEGGGVTRPEQVPMDDDASDLPDEADELGDFA